MSTGRNLIADARAALSVGLSEDPDASTPHEEELCALYTAHARRWLDAVQHAVDELRLTLEAREGELVRRAKARAGAP